MTDQQVIIGMDPHKSSNTIVVMTPDETMLTRRRRLLQQNPSTPSRSHQSARQATTPVRSMMRRSRTNC